MANTEPESRIVDHVPSQLSPLELGRLAKELQAASDPTEAERIRDLLTRGFYGN